MKTITFLSALAGLAPLCVQADPAIIRDVTISATGGAYTVSVTLQHGDTGWDDYADGWRVEAADGTVLGTRTLFHPHVKEQPFTRSLGGVAIPEDLSQVYIRASTNAEGWDDATIAFPMPGR